MKQNEIKLIDIEASGFGLKSYPIEIAWRSEDGGFDSFLIIPHEKWTFWSEDAEKNVHHISRDSLYKEGISIEEACKRLNKMLRGKTLYSDNARFDEMWIEDLFHFSTLSIRPSFNIKQINSIYCHMGSKEKVQEFKGYLGQTIANHRALDDCDRYIKALNHFWPDGLRKSSIR